MNRLAYLLALPAAALFGIPPDTCAQNPIADRHPQITANPNVGLPLKPPRLGNTAHLTNTNLKRAFIARSLRVDPRSLGLSKPITLFPAQGSLHIPNRISTQISGSIHLSTWQNTIEFKGNATYWLYIENAAFHTEITHYLVVVSAKGSDRATTLITRMHQNNQTIEASASIGSSFQTINLIVGRAHPNAVVEIRARDANAGWSLQKVEITPVRG